MVCAVHQAQGRLRVRALQIRMQYWHPTACSVVCQAQCRTDLKEREILVAARRDKARATARRRWIRAWPAYSHAEYAPSPCRSPTEVGGTRHPCHAASPGHAIPLVPTETLEPALVSQALFRPVNTSQGSGHGPSQQLRQMYGRKCCPPPVICRVPTPHCPPPFRLSVTITVMAGLPLYRISPALATISSFSCPPLRRTLVA